MESGVYCTKEIKSISLRVKHIALGRSTSSLGEWCILHWEDRVYPIESGSYSIGENKSIPWRVVHKHWGDHIHPMESGSYSTREIKLIPSKMVHISLGISSLSHEEGYSRNLYYFHGLYILR
jgi:hypothetical protein